MSECSISYCLETNDSPVTAIEIGVSATGFHRVESYTLGEPNFAAAPTTSFNIPKDAQLRFWNLTAEDHELDFRETQWTLTASASNQAAPFDTTTLGTSTLTCGTHLDEGQPIKSASLRVYFVGVMDINQSAEGNEHAGGCCRTSIRLTVRARYNGYGSGVYPKFLKRKLTYEFYGWTTPPESNGIYTHFTFWRGARSPGGTVNPPVTKFYVERIREPFFGREARPEIYFDGDNIEFAAYLGQFIGGRSDYDEDENGDNFNNREYFIDAQPWVQVGATRQEREIHWRYYADFDYEESFFDSVIGREIDELLEPYEWSDFSASVLALLNGAGTSDPFDFVEYPNCEARLQWRDDGAPGSTMLSGPAGGPCVIKSGVQCCQSPDTNGSGVPRNYLYDDGHGESLGDWPLPATFPPECDAPGACAGFGPTGIPHDYGCITGDIGNSENGLYPTNRTSTDGAIGPFNTQAQPLWEQGISTLYANGCASVQQGVPFRSPPVHLMSSITYDTTQNGILVTWSPVRRWYNAAFCRRVYENRTGYAAPLLVFCEHSRDKFTSANIIPADAQYDATGRYTPPLTDGVTYQFEQGSPTEFIEDDSTGSPVNRGSGHFTKRAFHDLDLIGPPSTPVTSVLRFNDTLAPCAMLDDPARQNELVQPPDNIALTADWIDLGWHALMGAGEVWTKFAEIDCPDYTRATNPPCGCAP